MKTPLLISGNRVEKPCTQCKSIKPLSDFYVGSRGYLNSECKACTKKSVRRAQVARKNRGECKTCGAKTDRGTFECETCNRRAGQDHLERRFRKKQKAAELLGGICVDCEIRFDRVEVYDFHHVDASTKGESSEYILSLKWEKIEEELKKCVLLCANCHRLRHVRDRATLSPNHSDAFVPEQPGRVIEPRRK